MIRTMTPTDYETLPEFLASAAWLTADKAEPWRSDAKHVAIVAEDNGHIVAAAWADVATARASVAALPGADVKGLVTRLCELAYIEGLERLEVQPLPESSALFLGLGFQDGNPTGSMVKDLSPQASIPLGIYRHYKGNRYELIGTAVHSETLELLALYRPLYGAGRTWVRPLGIWNEPVEVDGRFVPRFAWDSAKSGSK